MRFNRRACAGLVAASALMLPTGCAITTVTAAPLSTPSAAPVMPTGLPTGKYDLGATARVLNELERTHRLQSMEQRGLTGFVSHVGEGDYAKITVRQHKLDDATRQALREMAADEGGWVEFVDAPLSMAELRELEVEARKPGVFPVGTPVYSIALVRLDDVRPCIVVTPPKGQPVPAMPPTLPDSLRTRFGSDIELRWKVPGDEVIPLGGFAPAVKTPKN